MPFDLSMLSILIFILILSVLVMLHEFGHFLAAKRAGIGVEEFGFGLPPRIWGKKIGQTLYSINWLPFGGFVKLIGEDPTDARREEPNSFFTKPLSARMKVVVAGVVFNFILAVLIFYIVIFALGFKVSLPLLVDHRFKFVNQTKQVLVADVVVGGAASGADISVGDSIVLAAGAKISEIADLQKIIRENQDNPVNLVLENPVNNKTREVVVVPKYNEELKAAAIGVSLGELAVLNYQTIPQRLVAGFIHSYNTLEYSGKIFGQLIEFAVRERDIRPVSEGVSGPVGIAQITTQAVALGPISVLQLFGLLSLNLAAVNILPIPALDGGRLFFLIVEAATRRRVYPHVEKWAHSIGFAILLGLIMLVTYNDILKLLR